MNAAAGRPVVVSSDTFALVAAAVEAWRWSGGLFDPTVLNAITAAGYDRTFDRIEAQGPAPLMPGPAPGCGEVVLGAQARVVILPTGVGIDPGGIGKGLAADWVVEQLLDEAAGACVNIGGDVRVAGEAPSDDRWVVAVQNPVAPEDDLLHLALAAGAVCTSSRARRRWWHNGRRHHHVIDPRTGWPARTPFVAATVVAGTATQAEALCKAVLIGGPEGAVPLLDARGASATVVHVSGRVDHVGDVGRFAA